MPELALAAPDPTRRRQQKQRLTTPVFFMHIAKTAGSFIKAQFTNCMCSWYVLFGFREIANVDGQ